MTFHLQIVVGYCAAARTIGQSTVPRRRSTQFAHSACTLTHKHKTSIAMQHALSIILFLGVFPYHALDRFEEFENDSTPFEKKDFYQDLGVERNISQEDYDRFIYAWQSLKKLKYDKMTRAKYLRLVDKLIANFMFLKMVHTIGFSASSGLDA